MEEGKAVCLGEELTYNCTIFDDMKIYPQALWSGFCADNSLLTIIFGVPSQESDLCGPFLVNATGKDGDCYTSTLTVTASPELNGTLVQCVDGKMQFDEHVGNAMLIVFGSHITFFILLLSAKFHLQVLPLPSPSPPKTPPLTLSPALP